MENEEKHKGNAKMNWIFLFYEFLFEENTIKMWNFPPIGVGAAADPEMYWQRQHNTKTKVISTMHENPSDTLQSLDSFWTNTWRIRDNNNDGHEQLQ